MMLLLGQLLLREDLLTDYLLKSRMMGDYHVRFRERLGGKLPRSTRLCALNDNDCKAEVNAVTKMEVGPPQVLYRQYLQTALRCFSGD